MQCCEHSQHPLYEYTAYVSIRQHTSAYVSIRMQCCEYSQHPLHKYTAYEKVNVEGQVQNISGVYEDISGVYEDTLVALYDVCCILRTH